MKFKKRKNKKKSAVRLENGQLYDIPAEGSLGLLAAGYKGIMLWREKKAEVKKKNKKSG